MTKKDLKLISALSANFHAGILACPTDQLWSSLQSFPHGACGDASLLLARYLKEASLGDFNYVVGDLEQQSHAWLEKERWIIDITAKQFDQSLDTIVITTNRTWHNRFKIGERRTADIEQYDAYTHLNLLSSYTAIIQNIPTNENL